MKKSVLIIGASSDIAIEVSKIFIKKDYYLYLLTRNTEIISKISDFNFLKKEMIIPIAVGAIQEIDRQLNVEKTKVSTLETNVTILETNLADEKIKVSTLQSQLAAIESRLIALES